MKNSFTSFDSVEVKDEVFVQEKIYADAETVWKLLQDHEGLANYPFVTSAKLLCHGTDHKNGTGAIREIKVMGFIYFVEEIPLYEPPHRYDYKILKTNLPIRNQIGRIEIFPQDGEALVTWRTKFETSMPLLLPFFRVSLVPMAKLIFSGILSGIKSMAENHCG